MNESDHPRPPMQPGQAWPLGATVTADGVNFAVFSAHADGIDLCLFDAEGRTEEQRVPLPGRTGDVWHGHLPGAEAGLVYGLRAQGPWRPDEGQRFNPHKLLLDPYAREVVGRFAWHEEHFGQRRDLPHIADDRDNAATALKARVAPPLPAPAGRPAAPRTPLADTVLYEVNVKGYSKLNPRLPAELRGTYAGLAHAESIAHLRRLGITAVSLLPVHLRVDEERLVKLGLSNHWGYNTLGFFCVEPRLAAGAGGVSQREEFRQMVDSLHAAGIEVILDVVYNHTAESDELGPTLSFRGLDNVSYYRLPASSRWHYENHAGCGNTLDVRQPAVRQLVLDSLRYWAGEMGVDGFRFDLAPVLGRSDHGFERDGAFFTALAQDPLLGPLKMIAEPWDIGPGGYQVGGFARGWLEWNDHFRDSLRSFWLQPPGRAGAAGTRADFARRLCGSADLFQHDRRGPSASVNYVVSHDGFTLRDLVSYTHRRNDANGENNRDGHGHNLSTNCGEEGPSKDAAVLARRAALQRALLTITLLAQGTPMLCAGDELGHSQRGNNNPYCQDNETTWIDWQTADAELIEFTAATIGLRRQLLPFANRWYSGLTDPLGLHDLFWLDRHGQPLADSAWHDPVSRCFACLIGQPGRARAPLLLLFNGDDTPSDFTLPAGVWQVLLDSGHPRGINRWQGQGEALFPLKAQSVVLLAAAGAV